MNDVVEIYGEKLYQIKNSFSVLAYIIDRCNFNCEYCYNRLPRTGNILNLGKLLNFVSSIDKPKIFLDLIGGEPSIHDDLSEFVSSISQLKKNIETTIYTNFSGDLDLYRSFIANKVYLNVTWHSKNRDFIEKINSLTEDEMKYVNLYVIMENHNINESVSVFDQLQERYNTEIIYLRKNDNYTDISYPEHILTELKNRELIISKRTPKTILKYKDGTIKKVEDSFFTLNGDNFNMWCCNAGVDFVYVHHDGNVYRCDENDKPIYNINSSKRFQIPSHPIICRRDCPCLFDIKKKRIFNG